MNQIAESQDISKYAEELIVRFGLCTRAYKTSESFLQAFWFYKDNYNLTGRVFTEREGLLNFTLALVKNCEQLRQKYNENDLTEMYAQFVKNERLIPVYGAIIINARLDRYLLVRALHEHFSWTFPKGKIYQGESEIECTVREVEEETGLNVGRYLTEKSPQFTIAGKRKTTMFVAVGVSETEHLQPTVREETGRIEWFRINPLNSLRQDELINIIPDELDDEQNSGKIHLSDETRKFESQFYSWFMKQSRIDLEQLIPYESLERSRLELEYGLNDRRASYHYQDDQMYAELMQQKSETNKK